MKCIIFQFKFRHFHSNRIELLFQRNLKTSYRLYITNFETHELIATVISGQKDEIGK